MSALCDPGAGSLYSPRKNLHVGLMLREERQQAKSSKQSNLLDRVHLGKVQEAFQ